MFRLKVLREHSSILTLLVVSLPSSARPISEKHSGGCVLSAIKLAVSQGPIFGVLVNTHGAA